MSEPKYKLNPKDRARFSELVARECVNFVDAAGVKYNSKDYPPLSAAEKAELERLCSKRSRKISAHPAVKEELRLSRKRIRRADYLLRKLKTMLKGA